MTIYSYSQSFYQKIWGRNRGWEVIPSIKGKLWCANLWPTWGFLGYPGTQWLTFFLSLLIFSNPLGFSLSTTPSWKTSPILCEVRSPIICPKYPASSILFWMVGLMFDSYILQFLEGKFHVCLSFAVSPTSNALPGIYKYSKIYLWKGEQKRDCLDVEFLCWKI